VLWDWVTIHPAAPPAALCSDRPATGKMSPISVGSLGTGRSDIAAPSLGFLPRPDPGSDPGPDTPP